MSTQKMTKEKQQKVVLFSLGGLFVLAALYQFAFVPLVSSLRDLEASRDKLLGDVQKAESALRGDVQTQKNLAGLRAGLEHIFASEIPPTDDALSWASQVVYAQTRQMKIEVVSIVEETSASALWSSGDLAKKAFKPYGVRLQLAASFEEIRNLVRALQRSNPRLSVSAITINSDGINVEKHQLGLTLEWPSWRDIKQALQPFDSGGEAKAEKKDSST